MNRLARKMIIVQTADVGGRGRREDRKGTQGTDYGAGFFSAVKRRLASAKLMTVQMVLR